MGGALLTANSGAVIADTFPPDTRGRAFGFNAMGYTTGAVIGILVGGAIATYVSWRWIFWINAPIGGLALAPISLVQVTVAGGLVLLTVVADHLFGIAVTRREWIGVTLTAAGLAALAATLEGDARSAHSASAVGTLTVFLLAHAGGTVPFLAYRTSLLLGTTAVAQNVGVQGQLANGDPDYGKLFYDTALSPASSAMKAVREITNVRHIALLERAHAAIQRALDAIRSAGGALSEEFVLADLQDARAACEEIAGRRASEDLLAHIFSRL